MATTLTPAQQLILDGCRGLGKCDKSFVANLAAFDVPASLTQEQAAILTCGLGTEIAALVAAEPHLAATDDFLSRFTW